MEKKTENCWFCSNCQQDYYGNPSPAVEVAIFNDKDEVLLSERGLEPNKGKWDMPGGFVDPGEQIEVALPREMKEELDLRATDLSKPVFVRSYTGKYPWGKTTYDILVFLFVVRIQTDKKLKAQDDVASVKWVKPEDIDQNELSIPKLYDYILECKTALEART